MEENVVYIVRDESGLVRCFTTEFLFAKHIFDLLYDLGHAPSLSAEIA